MLVALLLGFSCGLPLLLTGSPLQAWLRREGVNLEAIGLMALVGLPYTLKFLWAPLLDRYTIPGFGRRRGWLLSAQLALVASIAALGQSDPKTSPWMVAVAAFLVTLFAATQDIVVDAHRRETLAETELGLGSSLYVYGYRTGMLLVSGGGLILADHLPFPVVYLILAACMSVGIVTTLFAEEPVIAEGAPRTLRAAVLEPFLEYFARADAWLILLFILLYKVGDSVAGTMTTPFYLDVGFTLTEMGAVANVFGFWAVLAGLLVDRR
jgi:PAT family beta-lactamase induction signal transducer AmpG